jgi:hypothetical protein
LFEIAGFDCHSLKRLVAVGSWKAAIIYPETAVRNQLFAHKATEYRDERPKVYAFNTHNIAAKKKPLRCMAEGLKWLEEIVWGICLIEPVVILPTFDGAPINWFNSCKNSRSYFSCCEFELKMPPLVMRAVHFVRITTGVVSTGM